jgi:hypothetical protein
MVSIQPINISYLEDVESCFLQPKTKQYRKGGIMTAIMSYSPLFAYMVQVANLDEYVDSDMFDGTCLIPCKEYSDKYFSKIKDNLDHGTARKLVQDCLLENRLTQSFLFENDLKIPTLNKLTYITTKSETKKINNKYSIVKGDLQCINGIIHILNGLIDLSYQ